MPHDPAAPNDPAAPAIVASGSENAVFDDVPVRIGAFSITYREQPGDPTVGTEILAKNSSFLEALSRHPDGSVIIRPASVRPLLQQSRVE
ncbi:MAG: hypothetical protein JO010_09155 [Alphaproteobacteria bacterium]|nr:hypothetical protein [Alphaproteobacteria bacterium]